MRGIEEFKEELMYNSSLADDFYSAESVEEIIQLAKENGFEFTVDELQQDELLSEEVYASVNGGGDVTHSIYNFYEGKDITSTDGDVKDVAKMLVLQGKISPQQYVDNYKNK